MAFHTPVKALNPVDTKLPDHVVKGAVIVDDKIHKWNPSVTLEANGPMSAFIVIDKKLSAGCGIGSKWKLQSGDVNEVIRRVVVDLKLPPSEEYGLIFEEPKAFLTPSNLSRVSHGFMLTVTAAPVIQYSLLMIFRLIYIESSQSCLSLCLSSLRSILQLGVDDVGWSRASPFLVSKLATLVTELPLGRAKREDSNVVFIALGMIEQLLNSDSETIQDLVLSEVPAQSLIRHLEKSDERVALAALSLMNALHEKSDAPSREQIVK
ncbi:hypothetical protein OSTOST_04502, partial [Ostertagia ostertagi]